MHTQPSDVIINIVNIAEANQVYTTCRTSSYIQRYRNLAGVYAWYQDHDAPRSSADDLHIGPRLQPDLARCRASEGPIRPEDIPA